MNTINLSPVDITPDVMKYLETKDLIIRLSPNNHRLEVESGLTRSKPVYQTDIRYGSHMLITVSVNRTDFFNFGWHEENEEFLLIGDPNSTPMYLVIALCNYLQLDKKIEEKSLSSDDFITLKVKYNDPEVSFFTMKKAIPHGELVSISTTNYPTFYVTEPTRMNLNRTNFDAFELFVKK